MGFISVLLSSEENVKARDGFAQSYFRRKRHERAKDPSIRVRANSILSGSRSLCEKRVFPIQRKGF